MLRATGVLTVAYFLMSTQSGQLNEPTCFLSPRIECSVVLIIVPKIYNDETVVIAIFSPFEVLFFLHHWQNSVYVYEKAKIQTVKYSSCHCAINGVK